MSETTDVRKRREEAEAADAAQACVTGARSAEQDSGGGSGHRDDRIAQRGDCAGDVEALAEALPDWLHAADDLPGECTPDDTFRAVSRAILASDWLAADRARVWDEGYETRAATLGMTPDPNPYRSGMAEAGEPDA